MDAVEFLKTQKRMCKKYHSEKDADIKDFFKGCEKCPLWKFCTENEDLDCEKCVEVVENWSKTHPVIELTDQQKTAIRGRIAEGYLWVSRDEKESFVCFSVEKPYKAFFNSEEYTFDSEYSVSISNDFYDFVTFENSPLYLTDLLGGEE